MCRSFRIRMNRLNGCFELHATIEQIYTEKE